MPVSSAERDRKRSKSNIVDEEPEMREAQVVVDPQDPEYQNPLLLAGETNHRDMIKHQ